MATPLQHNAFSPKPTLKTWLYERIESGNYKGLEWHEQYNQKWVFKLPWVQETDPDAQEYYRLFHDWAERDGQPSTDSKKAKRNFRSAIDHSAHFEKVGKLVEQQTGSYKMYRFIVNENIPHSAKNENQQRSISRDSQESNSTISPPSSAQLAYRESSDLIKNPVQVQQEQYLMDNTANAFNSPIEMDMYHATQMVPEQLNHPNNNYNAMGDHMMNHASPQQGADNIASIRELLFDDVEMTMDIEECNWRVLEKLRSYGVTKDYFTSCTYTIAYSDVDVAFGTWKRMDKFCKIIYGDDKLVQAMRNFHLQRNSLVPEFTVLPEHRDCKNLIAILGHMKAGVLFWLDVSDMCIYMRRYCKAHVFYFNIHETDQTPVKVDRRKNYKIFSYIEFLNSLNISTHEYDLNLTSSISAPSKIEIFVGCEPKHKGYGKGIRITLHPLAAPKIRACESLPNFHEILLSAEETSLEQQIANLTVS